MSTIKSEITTDYIPGEDITIVWQHLYNGDEHFQRTIVGWYHGEPEEGSTKAFSHLGVMGQYLWDDTPKEEKPKNFKVLGYEYLNTGGNTMVGIFTVWLPGLKQTAYVLTNELGCTISSVDYISNEIDIEDYCEITIDACDFESLCPVATYFELYRYCYNEYIKSDCKYFGITYPVPYDLLSDELQSEVHPKYLEWCKENNGGAIPTNGTQIIVHPDFDALFSDPHEDDEDFKMVNDWRKWHNSLINNDTTDDELDAFYDKKYRLTFCGKRVYLPFTAETFNKIQDLLESVINEW